MQGNRGIEAKALVLLCLSINQINLCFYSKFIIWAVIYQPVQSAHENTCSLFRKQEGRQGLNDVNLAFAQQDLQQWAGEQPSFG